MIGVMVLLEQVARMSAESGDHVVLIGEVVQARFADAPSGSPVCFRGSFGCRTELED